VFRQITMREVTRLALQEMGVRQIIDAENGDDAFKKATTQPLDMIISDFNMPEMLGNDLARRIKKEYPHQVVVMVTAYADFLSPPEEEANPVDFIITKPFALGTIANALERAHEINKANRRKAGPSLPPPSPPP